MERQTGGRYQTNYLPATQSITKIHNGSDKLLQSIQAIQEITTLGYPLHAFDRKGEQISIGIHSWTFMPPELRMAL